MKVLSFPVQVTEVSSLKNRKRSFHYAQLALAAYFMELIWNFKVFRCKKPRSTISKTKCKCPFHSLCSNCAKFLLHGEEKFDSYESSKFSGLSNRGFQSQESKAAFPLCSTCANFVLHGEGKFGSYESSKLSGASNRGFRSQNWIYQNSVSMTENLGHPFESKTAVFNTNRDPVPVTEVFFFSIDL